jgi:hypothetical protein
MGGVHEKWIFVCFTPIFPNRRFTMNDSDRSDDLNNFPGGGAGTQIIGIHCTGQFYVSFDIREYFCWLDQLARNAARHNSHFILAFLTVFLAMVSEEGWGENPPKKFAH